MLDNQSTSLLRARQSQRDVPDDNDAGENHLQKLPQVIVDMEQRVGSALLCLWSDLPEWMKDGNGYVETGYRYESGSIRGSLQSTLHLHNESINIWSHVIGSLIFLGIPIYVFNQEIPPRYAVATHADILVCSVFSLGVAICFFLSATFHTIMNHSSRYFHLGLQLDFLGILILMFGATVPLIYYGFTCSPFLQRTYWTLLFALALLCAIATFQPKFRAPKLQWVRATFFSGFATASVIPILHAVWIYGWDMQKRRMGLQWVIMTLICNATGAVAYAIKFPEKWHPRRFDILGASHQILHVMVVFAGLAYALGVLQAFDYYHAHPDVCKTL